MIKKALIVLVLFSQTSCKTEFVVTGIYVSKEKGSYFKFDNGNYEYLSVSGDNASVICRGNFNTKSDTLLFNSKPNKKDLYIFCDSLETGIIKSKKTFLFRGEIYELSK
ncbi:MAG: hypothetical protein KA210_05050 [Bacteroidia bacterium]|nr:hypothetical protein [Bacteroidia bacterium]